MKKLRSTIQLMASLALLVQGLGFPLRSFAGGQPARIRGASGYGIGRQAYKQDELLVVYKSDVSQQVKDQGLRKLGAAQKLESFDSPRGRTERLRVPAEQLEHAMSQLKTDPNVLLVQKNFIYRATRVSTEPSYGQLWGLKNTGQTIVQPDGNAALPSGSGNPGLSGKDLDAEGAWELNTDCSGIIVAVVDSGINYNHYDLNGNMWRNPGESGANASNRIDDDRDGFVDNVFGANLIGNDGDPMDYDGHGTHVSGTIGAIGDNQTLGTGVCWKAKIMAVRVLNELGTGTTDSLERGIRFAVDHGAKVINLSLAGPATDGSTDILLSDTVKYAEDHDVLLVVAAGNEGDNLDQAGKESYPCSYPNKNIICVAALDQQYRLAGFSNRGNRSVDIGAPGVNVVSSFAGIVEDLDDDFNAGGTLDWTTAGGGWAYDYDVDLELDFLASPVNWGRSNYPSNADQRAYKTFSFGGADSLKLFFSTAFELKSGDAFKVGYRSGPGDPFSGSGINVRTISGTTEVGSTSEFEIVEVTGDITACAGATCTVGFQLLSNGDGNNGLGVFIAEFGVHSVDWLVDSQNVISGTSMATPHVTGLAALLWSYNASFKVADVIAAIKGGGTPVGDLAGTTTSGKAANALGSMMYIHTPSGLDALVGN